MNTQHTSLSTGKAYTGNNIHTLNVAAATNGFTAKTWGTYRQITAQGGKVRKGERGTRIAFAKYEFVTQEDGTMKSELIVKHFTVFNIEQADWAQEVAA